MKSKSKLLLIGLLLLIIGIGGKITSAESANSNSIYFPVIRKITPVRVKYAKLSATKYGPDYLVGEITNITERTVYGVGVTAEFFINHELFDTMTVETELPATFPGDSNLFAGPFDSYLDYHAECVSIDCEIIATVTSWSHEHDPEYLPITFLSKDFSLGYIIGTISGEIRNDNATTVMGIRVISDGNEGFIGEGILEKTTLAPGETTSYIINLYYPKFDPDSFVLLAQGAAAK